MRKAIVMLTFQSLSGLTLGLNFLCAKFTKPIPIGFQSLSGLTLGLNLTSVRKETAERIVSIPFRADTGFERG